MSAADEATETTSTKVAESVVDIAASGGAAVAVASSAGAKTPNKMDERIFTLNKILIDRVYDLICFFYPVKGNDRDCKCLRSIGSIATSSLRYLILTSRSSSSLDMH